MFTREHYGTWVRRKGKIMTPADYAEAEKAAEHFMTPIMNCPPGQKPGPSGLNGSVPNDPELFVSYMKCFDKSDFKS